VPFEELLGDYPKVYGAIQSALALFIVINPRAVASVFVGLTEGMDRTQQLSVAFRSTLAGGLILVLFALAGTYVFDVLKIEPAALQIAGGIIVFGLAFALIRGREKEFFGDLGKEAKEKAPRSIALYPLAVPLIAGPASITVVMTLSAKSSLLLDRTILLATIGGVVLWTFLSMGRTLKLIDRLGAGVSLIMPRVMALILAVIGIQFIIEGIAQVLPHLALMVQSTLETGSAP
jgi:multiple antibiotic resistance protein